MCGCEKDECGVVALSLSSTIGMVLFIVGLTLWLVGAAVYPYYRGEYANYEEAKCTVQSFQALVEYRMSRGSINNKYIGVAGVSVTPGDSDFLYAAVRQIGATEEGPRTSTDEKRAIEINFPGVQIGETVSCGVPPGDSFRNPLSNVTEVWAEGLIALDFDKQAAQEHLDLLSVLDDVGFGLFIAGVVLCAIAALLMCWSFDCCDDCCDDCCESCVDKYDDWKLERRMAAARAERAAARARANEAQAGGTSAVNEQHSRATPYQIEEASRASDFAENGILTHYTCSYGPGSFMKRFFFLLGGGQMPGEGENGGGVQEPAAKEAAPVAAAKKEELGDKEMASLSEKTEISSMDEDEKIETSSMDEDELK